MLKRNSGDAIIISPRFYLGEVQYEITKLYFNVEVENIRWSQNETIGLCYDHYKYLF